MWVGGGSVGSGWLDMAGWVWLVGYVVLDMVGWDMWCWIWLVGYVVLDMSTVR